ncbi:MAG: hypothetical protein FJ087_15890, partial [Deltaproteobacteria bacterium]|nr:hypothetical protein [Deltaproteobacteria bacterium]
EDLGQGEFVRVRVGIGRPRAPEDGDVVDWVLRPFADSESDQVSAALKKAAEALAAWVAGGVPAAQNRVNRRERPPRKREEAVAGRIPEGSPCPGVGSATGPPDRKEVE